MIKFEKNDVIINKEEFVEQNEINYLSFVLGYDFLNDMLRKSDTPECDISYDFCCFLSRQFLNSDEYQNDKYSTYEMLEKWLERNRVKIEKSYFDFINGKIITENTIFDDGTSVIKIGYKDKKQIALLKKGTENEREYIIAIDFSVSNNNLNCFSGYYYATLEDSLNDFKKLIDKPTKERKQEQKIEERGR